MSSRHAAQSLPVAPVKTSPWAGLSEIIAVASTVDVRSKVRAPEVVICPEGVTVTGNSRSTFIISTHCSGLGCLAAEISAPKVTELTDQSTGCDSQVCIPPKATNIRNGNKSPARLLKTSLALIYYRTLRRMAPTAWKLIQKPLGLQLIPWQFVYWTGSTVHVPGVI